MAPSLNRLQLLADNIIDSQELQICEWWFNVDCSRSEEFYPQSPENSPTVENEPEQPVLEVLEDILEDDFSPLARSESRVEGQREGRRRKFSRGGGGGGRRGQGRRAGRPGVERRERTRGRRGRQGFLGGLDGQRLGFRGGLDGERILEEEARNYDGYADYSQADPVYARDDFSYLDPVFAGDDFNDFVYQDYQTPPVHSQGDISEYYYY